MTFIARTHELKTLESAYSGKESAFIPVYGRRRVGKTELLLQFTRKKPGLYFVGKQAPAEMQRREFLDAAAIAFDEPLLANARLESWKQILKVIVERWKGPKKLVLVLDEFQWMVGASPELPSVLQELWDHDWKKSGKVMLILCGSYLGFMEREVLGEKSPLFGRRTAQMHLRAFNHLDAAKFHPKYSQADQARVYSLCGGIPAYLLMFRQEFSVEQNIREQLLTESAALYREADFLLREELRDLINYHSILQALAQGKSSPTGVSRETGIEQRALNYYLTQLTDLGYAQRRYPITEKKPAQRDVRYALDDPLLRFWFRFVFPHQSSLLVLGPERGFATLVEPHLDAYFGRCFERLCRESLPLIYARDKVRAHFKVGEYWDKHTQIDVVGVRDDNWTDLGECKWGDVPSFKALQAELNERVAKYPNERGATIGRHLFVRSAKARSKNAVQDCEVHTLADLYALE